MWRGFRYADGVCSEQRYHTDLADGEWTLWSRICRRSDHRGRPVTHSRRAIVNAIFYIIRSGCAWRLLHDLHLGRRLLSLLADMAADRTRGSGCAQRSANGAQSCWPQSAAKRRDHRYADQLNNECRRCAWVRRCEEGQWSQTASARGHPGSGAASSVHQRASRIGGRPMAVGRRRGHVPRLEHVWVIKATPVLGNGGSPSSSAGA